MGQPVKLSDALVLDARIAAEAQERSIAGQIEFWAKLGRSMELLLDGKRVLTLRRNAGARPLAEALAAVDTPEGRKRVADVLDRQSFPHYKQCSDQPGLLIRIDEDSTETIGRFVDRTFVASEGGSALWSQPVPEIKPRSAKKSLRKKSASFRVKRPPSPPSREKAA
jgi:hypothetical protein